MINIDDMEFANGKSFIEEQKKLEDMLGINKISPFGTYDQAVFEEKLKGATQADLQKIAQRAGLSPFLEKNRIKAALMREFLVYTKNSRRNIIPQPSPQVILDPKNPQHAETIKILNS